MRSAVLILVGVLALAPSGVAAAVAARSTRALPRALGATRAASAAHVSMIFGNSKKKDTYDDLTDLGPLTKEKRAIYKTDRTPTTEYVPDNLAWDGSQYYLLAIPFLVVVCLSLFGGVNLFGYSD
ncbi:hypothetical protein T492DRAFT_891937 [Pavlovales sp. CCMP2436]|nr:hypothetical protein T492DRAFT_891937 [Pavlovales sp. CCMP2436]